MKNDLPDDLPRNDYLVEIDGMTTSEHLVFAEALRVGLRLRQQFPHSDVKVRETNTSTHTADATH